MGLEGSPLFLQISGSLTELISNTSILAKTVLIILLVFSVVSWTIIFEKIRFFRRVNSDGKKFMSLFNSGKPVEELAGAAKKYSFSPEARLVFSYVSESGRENFEDSGKLDKFLDSRIGSMVADWESYLMFLATTATISPFLGLLGTVWGIMSSFLSMGVRGSANLFVVGPGIAEALITTIFGLGAAIPAVIGYNYIVRKIRRKEGSLVEFSSRFQNRIGNG